MIIGARPATRPYADPDACQEKVDSTGSVTLRHRGRLHHIGIGRPYAGWPVAMLVEGRDIEVVGLDGSPLRRLVLDPTKHYQRIP
jgi:hypothetical protein